MMTKKKTESNAASNANTARVVDGKLILSFPEAATPVVWQMDIDKAQSCSLEVHEDKKGGTFSLSMKNDKNEKSDIAVFSDKASAVQALMATSNALQNAHGMIRSGATVAPANSNAPVYALPPQAQKESSGEGAKAFVLAIVLIVVLIAAWSLSIPAFKDDASPSAPASGQTEAAAGSEASGVPVSADDFLNNRR